MDLIFIILSRLPVKSLCKFKSVSKQWLHLIVDPYFISMHRELCLQTPNILLLKMVPLPQEQEQKPRLKKRKMIPSLPQEPPPQKCTRIDLCSFNLDGSCKGKDMGFFLYLNEDENDIKMLPSNGDLICFVSGNRFYACNPSKQKMFELPEASRCTAGEVNAGMGYVKERDEYVFVHLFNKSFHIDMSDDIGCEVLRMSDGKDCEWKLIDAADCPFSVHGLGVLVDNVSYWTIVDDYHLPEDEAINIVSFDLAKEEFGTVSLPDGLICPYTTWSLVELGGSLCLVDNNQEMIDIWVMKDNVNHMWIHEYSIDMNDYMTDFLCFTVPFVYRNGEMWMVANQKLLCYDVEMKSIKTMDHVNAGKWTWLQLYTESFFSIGSR